jgi:hypothetical protein
MSSKLDTAVVLNLPLDVGSNEFGALKINVNTTHHAVTLPATFSGRLLAIRAFTNNVVVGLSHSSVAEVDSTAAATAGGTSAKVGATIVAGTLYTAVLPKFDANRPLYMICESGTANTVLEVWTMNEQVAP